MIAEFTAELNALVRKYLKKGMKRAFIVMQLRIIADILSEQIG